MLFYKVGASTINANVMGTFIRSCGRLYQLLQRYPIRVRPFWPQDFENSTID